MRRQTIAVTGTTGQLGRAICHLTQSTANVVPISRPSIDITDWPAVRSIIAGAVPDIVIHCAAATDVDGCERDPEVAYRINAIGTRNIAQATAAVGATLVYVSTNYVFDGEKEQPYHEHDAPNPISVYGASKLAGEVEAISATTRCFVVRTSWLYAQEGRNFALTMRRLMSERDTLQVVSDQFGNPTYAADVAAAILSLVGRAPFGTYHVVNTGQASWHEWASEIKALVGASTQIQPIPGSAYARAATPPTNGVLTSLSLPSLGITLPEWRDALRRCLAS